jgi:hypothetical protein
MKNTIPGFEKILEILPESWEEQARICGALTRSRKIKTAQDLLKVLLLYLTVGGSLGKTSAMLKLTEEISLNKNAARERITKSVPWLKWLCENICRNAGLIVTKPEWLLNHQRIGLADATDEAINGSNNADYRLHYMMDLFTFDTMEMHLTESGTGEKLSNFKQIQESDIIIADRAYGTIKSIEYLQSLSADFILRLKAKSFKLYNEDGVEIELESYLNNMKECSTICLDLFYKTDNQFKPIRICAFAKTAEQQQKSLRNTKYSNSRKMRGKVSQLQAVYSKYVVVATSLSYDSERIMELYRMRWQIELLFKRFKSIFNYDEMNSKTDLSVRAWFYGKLLVAAICEALVNQGRFSPNS